MDEDDLIKCHEENSWVCPVPLCRKQLSRKQTLKHHLVSVHGIEAGLLPNRYKMYEYDSSINLPKRTYYERLRKSKKLAQTVVSQDSAMLVSDIMNSSLIGSESSCSSANEQLPGPSSQQDVQPTVDTQVDDTYCLVDDYGDKDMDLCSIMSDEDIDVCSIMSGSSDDLHTSYNDENNATNVSMSMSPPLYVMGADQIRNCPISYMQHLLSMCAFALKHNISGVAMKDLARLIQMHLPDNSICELDISTIKKMCGSLDNIVIHEYCTICTALYPQDKCIRNCQTPGCTGTRNVDTDYDKNNIFTSTDLGRQIQSVLERDGNLDKIWASHLNETQNISDITSGTMYSQMKKEGGFLFPLDNNNVTLTAFTDGVPLYKSSKVSLWPLYLVINELPPNERYLAKNMLIWGIWQGSSKLQMNTFLFPFVQELQKLYTTGFTFSIQEREYSGKACLSVFTMDLQARAPVVNMAHHNGEFGCLYCEIPGNVVPSGKGHCRAYPFPTTKFPSRTDDSLIQNVGSKGIRGPSVLQAIPGFSITNGVVVDYMHGTLLGITKKMLELWFASKSHEEPYYIGHKVGEIDNMLMTIKPPYFVKRLPRKIQNNFNHWKASEFRSWLLFYSLPCLSGLLPDIYLNHYACLVEGIFLLLGDSITEDDLVRAELLLNAFYQNCADLYGIKIVGLNVHNLSHLVQCVKNWGPLWAYSCFGFESFNSDVLKLVHGTGNVSQQVIWSLNAQKNLELESRKLPDGALKSFFKDMLQRSSARLPKGESVFHCKIIKPAVLKQSDVLCPDLLANLKTVLQINNICKTDFKKAGKIVYGQIILYSMDCTRVKRRNSYTIHVSSQSDMSNIMQIRYFLLHTSSKRVVAVGTLFRMEQEVVPGRAIHCQQLMKTRDDACILIVAGSIKDHVVFMENKSAQISFVASIANHVERD